METAVLDSYTVDFTTSNTIIKKAKSKRWVRPCWLGSGLKPIPGCCPSGDRCGDKDPQPCTRIDNKLGTDTRSTHSAWCYRAPDLMPVAISSFQETWLQTSVCYKKYKKNSLRREWSRHRQFRLMALVCAQWFCPVLFLWKLINFLCIVNLAVFFLK